MIDFHQNLTTDEVIIKMSADDLQKKTITYVMELIAMKLADQWIEKHGETTLKELGVEAMKADIAATIEKRLSEMGTKESKEDGS